MGKEMYRLRRKVTTYEVYAGLCIGLGAISLIIAIGLFLAKIPGRDFNLPIDPIAFAAFGNLASGSVGLFWSLAGVILFYGALSLQREDLTRQREEFKQSITVAEQSMKSTQEQGKILQFQKFDNTFFNLLNQHNEIVKAASVTMATGVTSTGRECFAFLYKTVLDQIGKVGAHRGGEFNRDLDINTAIVHFEDWWQREEFRVGHYFRNLYNLIKFVDRNDNMSYDEKKVYTNIVRAQLSSAELLLLFYNCLSRYGSEKFKPLVQKYHLLKTVSTDRLLNEKHVEAYSSSAFE